MTTSVIPGRPNLDPGLQALSLLGHCYFMLQDFVQAAKMYEELVKVGHA